MTAPSIILLVVAVLVPLKSLEAATPLDRQRQKGAAVANLKSQKANLEKVTKLGPEEFDEVLKVLGIEDPGALFLLQGYRKVRAEIITLEKKDDPKDEPKIKALEETRDTYATGVFDQFEAILGMLRNRIKAEEKAIMRLDGIWIPVQPK
jgi:hypothetical protein